MRLKTRVSLLLIGVLFIGSVGMSPVKVHAETPTNEFTLTVPAETTLKTDGTAVTLSNGLRISDGDLADRKKVVVTATSENSWKLVGTSVSTKIGYGLYESASATETTTSWDFTKEEVGEGTTKTIYSKINTEDYAAAVDADYSDTITFTAEVKSDGVEIILSEDFGDAVVTENNLVLTPGKTWEEVLTESEGSSIILSDGVNEMEFMLTTFDPYEEDPESGGNQYIFLGIVMEDAVMPMVLIHNGSFVMNEEGFNLAESGFKLTDLVPDQISLDFVMGG